MSDGGEEGAWKNRVAWQPDDEAKACPHCGKEFSLTVRRHHCRACGRCVCGSCSKGTAKVRGYEGLERVCDECKEKTAPSAAAVICNKLLVAMGCVTTPEARARRDRRKLITEGCVFTRKRGMLSLSKQKVTVKLVTDDGAYTLRVTPVDKSITESAFDQYPLTDIGRIDHASGSCSLSILSPLDASIVDLEAHSARIAEKWAEGLSEALEELTTDASATTRVPVRRTKAAKVARQKYFKQKDIELANRKDDAERRKQKILRGGGGSKGLKGLKYTAIAMANRDSLSGSNRREAEGVEY